MSVEVASRLRQALSDTVFGSSLAGDGLLVRMRRATIALLAVVAAVGLGLIAFVSQVGWPTVFSGPIPRPEPGVVHNDPIAAPRLFASRSSTRAQAAVRRPAATPLEGAGVGAPSVLSGSEVGSSHQPEAPPVEPAPPASAPPQQAEAPDAAPEPAPIAVSGPDRPRPPEVEETRAARASKTGRPPGKPRGKRGHAPKAEPPPPQVEDDGDDYGQEEEDNAPEKDERGSGRDGHGKPDWAGH